MKHIPQTGELAVLAAFLYASQPQQGPAKSAAAVATALEIYEIAGQKTEELRAQERACEPTDNLGYSSNPTWRNS